MIYSYTKNLNAETSLIAAAARSLKEGRVLVLPTDTIYGLSCRADDKTAIKKIFHLKKRDPKSALLVLVNSLAMLKKYVFVSRRQEELIRRYWRAARPTTVILRQRGNLPKELTGASDGLALRLPKSKFLIKILNRVGVPLVSTSLNTSGEEPISDLKNLSFHFPTAGREIDLIIDTGQPRYLKPSRLIDLRGAGRPIILRK
ncbi:MAG: L-threonylcarbamoyladenylate synthase [Candidatus Falkowbacteria bacterium]|nr:L-threonylcarbamoyladenylate synthase [Candidatus Falkowbacteria bacterium]